MSQLRIQPVRALQGEWLPPGDKSISHRSIILGSLARGRTEIAHFLEGDDCLRTIDIAMKLGAPIARLGEGRYVVEGEGKLSEASDLLDVGNSGTGFRLWAGVLAGQPFYSVLTGDASIRRRPMKRITEPLKKMKANLDGRQNAELAPLSFRGGALKAIKHRSEVASAQVKSCVLLAGLFAEGVTSVTEPSLSRDHTERMLEGFGASIQRKNLTVSLEGGQSLSGAQVFVPADISSAAFFLVGALLLPGSELLLKEVGVNPTRTGILDALEQAGANIQRVNERVSGGESISDLLITPQTLTAFKIDAPLIPRLVDEIPILAVAATQAEGETIITDAQELRVKESDRLATIAMELRKMDAQIEEQPDGLRILGPTPLKGASVQSHGDHRIAMSLAIAGLLAEGETTIDDTDCIETSFPDFEQSLRSLAH